MPAGVKPGVRNYRIWGATMLRVAPLYVAPLANCGTLFCYTSGTAAAPNARAVRLDAADRMAAAIDLGAGLECRGIAAEPDGHFAALLWDGADRQIYVRRFDLAGTQSWSTELTNATTTRPTSASARAGWSSAATATAPTTTCTRIRGTRATR